MNEANLDKVKELALDLSQEEPRSPGDQLGGHTLAARTLDKCRAELAGTPGDFQFNCPMDQRFFRQSGIDAHEFKNFVATGADDAAVGAWIEEHANSAAQ